MNQVQLDGRLTRDPEVQYTRNGKVYAKFSIASYMKQHGEDGVMYVPCVAFGEMAERIGNEASKGTKINIEQGTLRIEKSQDGSKTYTSVTVWQASFEQPKKKTQSAFDEMADEEIPF